ncbi:hypothetical protein Pla123a_27830 [Posidoniimonas polymericola]|uniref:Uncharacterized protein n=1 Tax=Posidoniimonas polymericola TaxID=2528002 RepID=A0A5C5YMH1_9BACT|nr:hypothetical protein [Posidoniimonas polymericola]TWT75997.1 hypothetical protein Pla123a_27830 [Posidoniimonas polymericola]
MPSNRPAPQVLDEEFLIIRAKVLEVAAALDRLDRGAGELAAEPRHAKLRQAIELLLDDQPGRAERLQLLFSREYEPDWRAAMGVGREDGE